MDIKRGPYPLVVFAHGLYGSGYNSAYFMEYLASHGYMVVAPDYIDTVPPDYQRQIAFSRIKTGKALSLGYVVAAAGQFARRMGHSHSSILDYLAERRLPQTSFVIEEMIKMNRTSSSWLYRAIDEYAICLSGHSLGGSTVLGKLGAHPSSLTKDIRIRAALIFSAPSYPFENSIGNTDVPIMIMSGDNDKPGLRADIPRRTIYDGAKPPKYYLILKDATHLTFTNKGGGGLFLNAATSEKAQTRAICQYGLAFFEKHVGANTTVSVPLNEKGPAWEYYIKEEKFREAFEWGKEPPQSRGGLGGIKEAVKTDFKKQKEDSWFKRRLNRR